MPTLERAIEIAARAHAGQTDKAGQPYILHPLRLMLAVTTLHERMAAVLHDVVEDTKVTFADLTQEGFPEEVITAIKILTKHKGESRLDASKRAVLNPIARCVKLADVADNMDLSRIINPTQKDYARIKEYEEVRKVLLEKWKIEGWDTFDAGNYSIAGEYATEAEAIEVAKTKLLENEKDQPTETSGGQNGVQDQVFIVRPDGSKYRYRV